MSALSRSAVTAGILFVSVVGCNAILDNQDATLADTADSSPPTDPNPSPITTDDADAATPADAAADVADAKTDDCLTGQHLCNGTCVSLTDPTYGCGDPSCAACPSTHSTMGCQGRTCIVAACDPGYANCNAMAADGCETDMAKPDTCGACNAVCAPATPLCAASGASFQCTNGCTADMPVNCGGTCVDPNSNPNHCGACNVKCPVVTNGTATCGAATCGFTCKAAFHACAGKCPAKTDPTACGAACTVCPVPAGGVATCVADTCGVTCTAPNHLCGGRCVQNDPTACGAACTVCAIPPNSVATCAAEVCGSTCSAGYGDCNAMAADGCESSFATDPLNCGGCAKPCAAGHACIGGACAL